MQVVNSLHKIGKFVNIKVNEVIGGKKEFGYRSKVWTQRLCVLYVE
jgi:hypothetical protein